MQNKDTTFSNFQIFSLPHLQGDHKWIGTTEACALLRHQNVRAEIIDFMGMAFFSQWIGTTEARTLLRHQNVCAEIIAFMGMAFEIMTVGINEH